MFLQYSMYTTLQQLSTADGLSRCIVASAFVLYFKIDKNNLTSKSNDLMIIYIYIYMLC